MFAQGQKKGTLRFSFQATNGGVKNAFLAGDFNDWQPKKMRKQKDNTFVVVVPADKGEHQYKFLIDDQWLLDPENDHRCVNSYGTLNSVAMAE
jgi:1,4-alpha-glucan branching enzyme